MKGRENPPYFFCHLASGTWGILSPVIASERVGAKDIV